MSIYYLLLLVQNMKDQLSLEKLALEKEKLAFEKETEEKKLAFEKEIEEKKLTQEKEIEEKKLAFEKEKLAFEKEKLAFEKEKLAFEKEKRAHGERMLLIIESEHERSLANPYGGLVNNDFMNAMAGLGNIGTLTIIDNRSYDNRTINSTITNTINNNNYGFQFY